MLSADRLVVPMAPGSARPRRDPGAPALEASGASHAQHRQWGEHVHGLAARAARLDHRRRLSLEAADRLARGDRARTLERSARIKARLARFARRTRIDFHRTIDDLVYAGGFELAMTLLAERRAALAAASAPRTNPHL
jgi:hypothetical protein